MDYIHLAMQKLSFANVTIHRKMRMYFGFLKDFTVRYTFSL